MIEDALREVIARSLRRGSTERPTVPVFTRGTGLAEGVDLDDTSALLDRQDVSEHLRYREWFDRDLLSSQEPFALADVTATGFMRIVTHPRIFSVPATLEEAFEFVESLRAQRHPLVT